MTIETSTPVTEGQFYNRRLELEQLCSVVSDARKGGRRWVALLGHRKIGKTSLLLELRRRCGPEIPLPYIDCWEVRSDPLHFLCTLIRTLIAAVVRKRGLEADVGPIEPEEEGRFSARVIQALSGLGYPSVDRAVRLHEKVFSTQANVESIRQAFELPEALASDLGEPFIVILDEFQELDRFRRFRRTGSGIDDVFGLLRSTWQKQEGVSYIVAGSRMRLMREILTGEESAFFQHFELMNLGSFKRADSLKMLDDVLNTVDKIFDSAVVHQILDLLGDHPFYVRALVQEMRSAAVSITGGKKEKLNRIEQALKEALEAVLFEQNGRLSLYMEQRYRIVTGDSSTLESVLRGFVEPARITDVANRLHIRTGAVSTAVKTLLGEDVLEKCPDGRYAFSDPTFSLWLKQQVDFRLAMPPLLVGNASEQTVARKLAVDGFRSVYQSRASRGSFDLLAVHDSRIFGIQVKTGGFPSALRPQERTRLMAEAKHLGFHPVLALVLPEEVRFYDLRRLRSRRGSGIHEKTAHAETLLSFL